MLIDSTFSAPFEYSEYLPLQWPPHPHQQQLRWHRALISLCETSPWSETTPFSWITFRWKRLLPQGWCTARSDSEMYTLQSVTKSTAGTGFLPRWKMPARIRSVTPQTYAKLTICCFGSSTFCSTNRLRPCRQPNIKTSYSSRRLPRSSRKRFGWQSSTPR